MCRFKRYVALVAEPCHARPHFSAPERAGFRSAGSAAAGDGRRPGQAAANLRAQGSSGRAPPARQTACGGATRKAAGSYAEESETTQKTSANRIGHRRSPIRQSAPGAPPPPPRGRAGRPVTADSDAPRLCCCLSPPRGMFAHAVDGGGRWRATRGCACIYTYTSICTFGIIQRGSGDYSGS